MKKILFLITTISIFANAEMVQRGDGGVFISNDDQKEMMMLLSDETEKDDYKEMDKMERKEKKSKKTKVSISEEAGDDFSLPEREGRKHKSRAGDNKSREKIRLKEYRNIQYDESMFYYSLEQPSPRKFNKFLKNNNINKMIFKNLLGYGNSLKEAKVSALYYDFYKEKPSIAENFYKILYKRRADLSLSDKLLLADYLLRTGRGNKATAILKKGSCLAVFGKNKYKCLYFLGVEKYLKTGESKNSELSISKRKIKQAKELYYRK